MAQVGAERQHVAGDMIAVVGTGLQRSDGEAMAKIVQPRLRAAWLIGDGRLFENFLKGARHDFVAETSAASVLNKNMGIGASAAPPVFKIGI